MSLESSARDSIPITPKHFGVKRSRSEPPSPVKPHLLDSEDRDGTTNLDLDNDGPAPQIKKRPRLFRRLKIPINRKGPVEYTPEYLALLAAQRKTPESPTPQATNFHAETLAVPVDFLQDLVDARWKAERARCDAEHEFQTQQVKNLPRA